MTGVLPLLTRIAEARHADTVWQLATGHFAGLGFSRVVYGLSRGPHENAWADPSSLLLSTRGADDARHDLDSGLFVRTALFRWAERNEGACTWSCLPEAIAKGQLHAEELEAVRQNREPGMVAGITVAFPRLHARTRAALGLIADAELSHDRVDAIWVGQRDEILAVAHVMHLALLQHPASPAANCLTRRQREALEWVADGKTTLDIALVMGVSAAMVEKHLRLAREALEVDTTAQAIARAVALNLLFPVRNSSETYTKEVGNP